MKLGWKQEWFLTLCSVTLLIRSLAFSSAARILSSSSCFFLFSSSILFRSASIVLWNSKSCSSRSRRSMSRISSSCRAVTSSASAKKGWSLRFNEEKLKYLIKLTHFNLIYELGNWSRWSERSIKTVLLIVFQSNNQYSGITMNKKHFSSTGTFAAWNINSPKLNTVWMWNYVGFSNCVGVLPFIWLLASIRDWAKIALSVFFS